MNARHRTTLRRGAGVLTSVSALAAVAVIGASGASAHMGVDLHGATPTAGSGSTIFLRPGHGCDGDTTNAVTVTIPAGVTNAKPQQKAGWTLTHDATTITWSRGALPDDEFDDFGIKLTWPKLADGVMSQKFYFKTVQTCNAELKVSRSGADATVTGFLPRNAGQQVSLFVDDVPLTKHPITVGSDGRFSVRTSSAKIPATAAVTAKLGTRVVGTSTSGVDAWTNIPGDGSDQSMPAPSVNVSAAMVGGH